MNESMKKKLMEGEGGTWES